MSPSVGGPPISYLPDPNNPAVLYAQFDALYSPVQQYYNSVATYHNLDQSAIQLSQESWNQWALGAVNADRVGQFSSYRAAPVAPDGHIVKWNGSGTVITDSGKPVWTPDPNWNVKDWVISQDSTGKTILVHVNDPAAQSQGDGAFAGLSQVRAQIAAMLAPMMSTTSPAVIASIVAQAFALFQQFYQASQQQKTQ